ncbi:hypothetical protein RJ641_013664 [Dillenia turbinata]|uniref:Uncharacterized protein n=1 Tax=Dillenia turbinata TaxID=194707 RepID=A0AAN8W6G2_9MAGN
MDKTEDEDSNKEIADDSHRKSQNIEDHVRSRSWNGGDGTCGREQMAALFLSQTTPRYPYLRLDGTMSIGKGQLLVNRFNDLSKAAARVWRDGQKKRVYIYIFLSSGTIEEKVFQHQMSKEGLQKVIQQEQADNHKAQILIFVLPPRFGFVPSSSVWMQFMASLDSIINCRFKIASFSFVFVSFVLTNQDDGKLAPIESTVITPNTEGKENQPYLPAKLNAKTFPFRQHRQSFPTLFQVKLLFEVCSHLACLNMFNNDQQGIYTPRISFSHDFVDTQQAIKQETGSREAPASSDFEFRVKGYSMMSADELFSKGKLLPLKENCTKMTLRDELLVDDGSEGMSPRLPKGTSGWWKERLGLKRAHIASKKTGKSDEHLEKIIKGKKHLFVQEEMHNVITKN